MKKDKLDNERQDRSVPSRFRTVGALRVGRDSSEAYAECFFAPCRFRYSGKEAQLMIAVTAVVALLTLQLSVAPNDTKAQLKPRIFERQTTSVPKCHICTVQHSSNFS